VRKPDSDVRSGCLAGLRVVAGRHKAETAGSSRHASCEQPDPIGEALQISILAAYNTQETCSRKLTKHKHTVLMTKLQPKHAKNLPKDQLLPT
jgi:hypothetical protein